MFFSVSKLILLITALSVDAFAAGFAYGADKVKIPLLSALIVASLSDFILLLSLLIGSLFKTYVPAGFTTVLSFSILFLLGTLKMFDSSIKKKIKENKFTGRQLRVAFKNLRFILTVYAMPEEANTSDIEILSPTEALSLGLALSLDSAAAGIGAASSEFSLSLTALLTFLISMSAILGGCRMGHFLSARSSFNFSVIGGILLILLSFTKLF